MTGVNCEGPAQSHNGKAHVDWLPMGQIIVDTSRLCQLALKGQPSSSMTPREFLRFRRASFVAAGRARALREEY